MRICHLITRLIVGGAQENTVLTCRGLAERGHDVWLAAGPETGPEGSLWPQVEPNPPGLRTVRVNRLRRAVRPLKDARCLGDLREFLQEGAFDVVHTHSSKAGIVGRLAARDCRPRPLIVHTLHGMSFNRTQPALIRRLYRMAERHAARCTDAFISVADAMTRQAVEAGLAPPERFTTIRSGMLLSAYQPDPVARNARRREWHVADDEVVVGTIARLFRHKGYEQILEAMPRMVAGGVPLRFVWVGDGAQRGEYEARLRRLGLSDRVHFTGLVLPERIPETIAGFDLLLHASQWEGLPRALPQALLMEVPVVSFDNDGAPEVVADGRTGRLVPLGDTESLADAVLELSASPELRKRLGSAGRRDCLHRFDHVNMVDRIANLYREQLGARTG